MNPDAEVKGIKLTIDSRLENIGLVGLAIQALCSYVGFGGVDTHQIQLGVVEAVNNIVDHAYGGQAGHEVVVAVSIYPDRISFRLMDTGKTMKPRRRGKIEFDPANLATLPEGGRGLYIIQAVMDGMDYQTVDGTNIFTMNKYLPKA